LEQWLIAGAPLRSVWEARKAQPVEADRPSEINQPKVASTTASVPVQPGTSQEEPKVVPQPAADFHANVVINSTPEARTAAAAATRPWDPGEFHQFLAAGCTRDAWEKRRQPKTS